MTGAEVRDTPEARPWMNALGALVLLGGLAVSLATVQHAVDFPVLYVMGAGIATGTNVYVEAQNAAFHHQFGVSQFGMFYPPATGFVMMPFSFLPYPVAKWLFVVLTQAAIIFGIRALVRVTAPQAHPATWAFVAAAVLASSALRWGMMLLQIAPLAFGSLCLLVVCLQTGRFRLAATIVGVILALKMTLALPFLGLLALYRRFTAVVVTGSTWVLLNVAGFLRMGEGSFAEYRRNLKVLESLDNISSPDPWRAIALPRLDWVSLFYGFTENLLVSRAVGLLLSGAVAVLLIGLALRVRDRPSIATSSKFLAAFVALGSLAVYHHHYDAILFFAPAISLVLLGPPRPLWCSALMAPLLLMVLLLPIGVAQNLLQSLLGPPGVGILKLSFPIACALALLGSLGVLLHAARSGAFEPAATSRTFDAGLRP